MSPSAALAARSTSTRRSAAEQLTVGELARRSGVTTKALRYYESIGLLPPPARRPSGYRAYDPSYEERLGFILRAKRLGLSLDEVRQVLELSKSGSRPCAHVLGLLGRHLAALDEAIAQLDAFRAQLRRLQRQASRRHKERGGTVCGIIEHAEIELPERAAHTLGRWRARTRRLGVA